MKWIGKCMHRQNTAEIEIPERREVTENGLSIWLKLPVKIRQDPILAAYQSEFERSQNDTENIRADTGNSIPNAAVVEDDHGTQPIATIAVENNIENSREEQSKVPIVKENPTKTYKIWLNYMKIAILLGCWAFFAATLMTSQEKELPTLPMSVAANKTRLYTIRKAPENMIFEILLTGTFSTNIHQNTTDWLLVSIQIQPDNASNWDTIDQWRLLVTSTEINEESHLNQLDRRFDISDKIAKNASSTSIRIAMEINFDTDFAFQFALDGSPVDKYIGIIIATLILICLYILIISEIVEKTFATIIASTFCISIMAIMGCRPTLDKVIGWIDIETLFLLFGMMIIVGIMSETGLFDFLAVYAYQITKGQAWPLIYCLCLFTAILSAFLDNVTTLLLMAPVSIRLCEIMALNPIPILTSMILYSNIGGALTPVGDPPNIIIISNSYVTKNGITFTNFILHMITGVVLACLQTFIQLRFKYRTINDLRAEEPREIAELRQEIDVWQRALDSISLYSNDDDFIRWTLVDKIRNLRQTLQRQIKSGSIPKESYSATLADLQAKYPIRNKPLLIKSMLALVFVLGFFFLHSVPGLDRLSLGWIAFLGALLVLVLADRKDMDVIVGKVEWTTLIFFASLFVLIEALSELGLIDWIGSQTVNIIVSVDEKWRLAVAILIILWISAIASSFLDNIPLTTMMIKITVSLAQNEALGLPLAPLIWALSFGACFGGNGTLIGASANIICAGVAEQHGCKMNFFQYFKIGFPMMIGNVLTATAYLMVAHVWLEWH